MATALSCARCAAPIAARTEATLLMHHELSDFSVRHIELCLTCGSAFYDFLKRPAPVAEAPPRAGTDADAPAGD